MKWATMFLGLVAAVAMAAPVSAGHPLGPRPGFYPQPHGQHGQHGHPASCCCSSCCGPRARAYPRSSYYPPYRYAPPYYGGSYRYGRSYYPSYRYPSYGRGGVGIQTGNFGFHIRF